MASMNNRSGVHLSTSTERPLAHLLTVQEAGQMLGVSASTLYGWVWQRKITFVKVGRALRFDRADLEKFIQVHKFEARK
jgi:excisionase family DNA binding protein